MDAVQAGAGEVAGAERLHEGCFFDDGTSGRCHQDGAWLHPGHVGGAQGPAGGATETPRTSARKNRSSSFATLVTPTAARRPIGEVWAPRHDIHASALATGTIATPE